ncbi:hypothetical protein BH11CYA1_BH11CYA1_35790 [soil metagenome]
MAEKVYKEQAEVLKCGNPELVEAPQELKNELSLNTGSEVESQPSLSEVIRAKVAEEQVFNEELQKSDLNYTEKIWTSVYDFDGPGKFADDHCFSKWWNGPGQQIFNFIYFGLGAAACCVIAQTSGYLYKTSMVGLCLFGALCTAALIYALCRRKPIDPSDVLSDRAQKIIRRTALVLPFMAITVASWNCLTYGVEYLWVEGLYPGYNKNMSSADYEVVHKREAELAATISPLNTAAAKQHFEATKAVGSYALALKMADKVIRFNRRDSRWKIRRLGVLGRLPDKANEFERLTRKYKARYGTDGYLWNTLADTAVYNKDWLQALDMANEHIKIHDNEAIAYEQRASIYQELGMNEAADEDRANAARYAKSKEH